MNIDNMRWWGKMELCKTPTSFLSIYVGILESSTRIQFIHLTSQCNINVYFCVKESNSGHSSRWQCMIGEFFNAKWTGTKLLFHSQHLSLKIHCDCHASYALVSNTCLKETTYSEFRSATALPDIFSSFSLWYLVYCHNLDIWFTIPYWRFP